MKVEAKYLVSHARNLISKGEYKSAIQALLVFANVLENKSAYRDLTVALSQLNELIIHGLSGTMDRDFSQVQLNRLIVRVLDIMEGLEYEAKHREIFFELTPSAPLKPKVKEWMDGLLA
jgi:hypothetical protein